MYELNVSQDVHQNLCYERFDELDDQIHGIHDLLISFNNKDNSRDE